MDDKKLIEKAFGARLKSLALENAIKANCGQSYDEDGKSFNDPDKLIEAAKKIEAYLTGEKANEDV